MVESTDPQKILEALKRHNFNRQKTADEIGIDRRTVIKWINRLRDAGHDIPRSEYDTDRTGYLLKQAMAGHKAAPEGYYVKGVSTLYDASGEITAQWVKTSTDEEKRQEAIREAYKAMAAEVYQVSPTIAPNHVLDNLANLYTITDAHIGMHSWGVQTGKDWDLKIAEEVITGIFLQMIAASPPAKVGIINQLGDYLHFDSIKPVTPTSGHLLDADSRYPKMAEVGCRVLRRIIMAAVAKHELVHIVISDDNHSPVGAVWQRLMFKAIFENEPRVTVDMSPSPFTVYQHGKTMLGFHHGHKVKKGNLPLLFAARFPANWGQSVYRYIHTGHLHHVDEKEHPGVYVIQHPTLAAQDAYSHDMGFESKQAASSVTYHLERGQVGRQTFVPEMLAA